MNSSDPDYGFTALFWASARGHEKVVKFLLAQPDIKLDAVNIDGDTVLMTAAELGHTEIVELLLRAGETASITDAPTPLCACTREVWQSHQVGLHRATVAPGRLW